MEKLIRFWKSIPDQIKRLSIPVVIVVFAFFVARHFLTPQDFGKQGPYRASAVVEEVAKERTYAGHEACLECHGEVGELKKGGYHRDVACEVCHGPANGHIADPSEIKPEAPRGRGYCPLCHEYLPSRPTGFPQIVAASHNPMKPCISCHEPHNPKPPEVPKECEACHTQIARTKALSPHVYISCIRCHETTEDHKVAPRENLPQIPKTRDFCGECHSREAVSSKEIPRIDMATHGERYVCWQCHYPHLPEAK